MSDRWKLPVKTLSPSSINQFQRCPEAWRRKYVHGEWPKGDASASSIMGNAVHGSAEQNFRQKTTSGIDFSVPDIEEAYDASFENEVEKNGGAGEVNWTMKVGKEKVKLTPDQARSKARPLAVMYHTDVAKTIQPLGTEEWFTLNLDGIGVPIRGKIDIISQDKKKSDMKFSTYLKKTPDVSWRLQALTYMLVDKTTNKDGTTRIGNIGDFDFEWHTGTFGGVRSGPQIMTPRQSPELGLALDDTTKLIAYEAIKSAVDSILAFWDRFGPDNVWPGALQHTWSCDFCHFNPKKGGDCFWWAGKKNDLLTLF